ncbi:MAG TPA: HNH endonuclease [Leptospiraceae bacterium]|nr:HNH endonuclease [Leptospirales bacterium]HMU83789.1 HNH endonuclease [Leptospiraceae bacterium]HMW59616.1 HNH endonuclease [Leptospiraceae bacterium]HMX57386.1 HNH endonuclease [Leptospiraceae bacterium]HMZ35947.1 HNH endonuclease [Leptospiraceae bacterium]
MRDVLQESVLVLNTSMIAIDICSARTAILEILRNIAIPIKESEDLVRSEKLTLHVPRIIAQRSYHKIPRYDQKTSKINIIYRDDQTCCYCGVRFPIPELTVDHVIPRSRWKKITGETPPYDFNSWWNLVTACRRCNSVKANRLLQEIGWKLQKKPDKPKNTGLVIARQRAESLGWMEYCRVNVRLVESV